MNSMSVARNLGVDLRRAHDNTSSQADFQASTYVCHGEFMIEMSGGTAGEVTRDVNFPVTFLERPLFFDGGSLEESQSVTIGSIPTIGGIVISWVTEEKGQAILYKGARLGVVTTGDTGTRFWYNWHFVGLALANPIGGSITTEGTV